jgi:hypothetical protein
MSAAMAEILGPGRQSYLFDSFEGLPPADLATDGPRALAYQADPTGAHYHNNCRAERAEAEAAMRLAGVPTPHLLQGWFNVTLPDFVPLEPIRVLRLDGDWYASTKTCLEALYSHVGPGGLILIDDYFAWDGCARAVHEYLRPGGAAGPRAADTPRRGRLHCQGHSGAASRAVMDVLNLGPARCHSTWGAQRTATAATYTRPPSTDASRGARGAGARSQAAARPRDRVLVPAPAGPRRCGRGASGVAPVRGEPMRDFRRAWVSACRGAGMPGLLKHDLRRSAVRQMVTGGFLNA